MVAPRCALQGQSFATMRGSMVPLPRRSTPTLPVKAIFVDLLALGRGHTMRRLRIISFLQKSLVPKVLLYNQLGTSSGLCSHLIMN